MLLYINVRGLRTILKEADASVELIIVGAHDAADNVRVAVEELGDGVDDNVGAQVERVLEVGRQERVVNDEQEPPLTRHGCHLGNVNELQCRIRGRFHPYQLLKNKQTNHHMSALSEEEKEVEQRVQWCAQYFGLVVDDALQHAFAGEISKGKLKTHGSGDLGEVTESATVAIVHGSDVVSALQQMHKCDCGSAARGERNSCGRWR